MKNIKKKHAALIFLFAGLLSVTSCNDDFLNKSPEDRINDNAVWKTTNDLKLYVNNFYNQNGLLPRRDGFDYSALWSAQDAIGGSDTEIAYAYNSRMNGETTVPESGGGWGTGDWSLLRNINYFFANYTKVTGDEAEINRYVGEALFFRAIFYFDKLRRFGDVPWYEELISSDDTEAMFKARDSRKVVVEHLMSDLDRAVSYLPSRGATLDGRVNKEAAMTFQARIALYEGTWEKYHAGTPFGVSGSDGSAFIQKAAAVTDSLIALGTCDLDNVGVANGYTLLFNQHNYAASKEVMLWRQYDAATGIIHKWNRYSWTGAGVGLTKRMIDYYLCSDGKPIDGNALYQGDETVEKTVANRDPRLRQTICVKDGQHYLDSRAATEVIFRYPSLQQATGNRSVTGYQLYKGHDYTLYDTQDGVAGLIYFRYGEALLINAEAKAELGTITQADVDRTVNKLRDRVGMAHLKLSEIASFPKQFPTLSPIINEVRRERAVELVAEGFRVSDIFRWAAAGELIRGYQPLGAKLAQWTVRPTDPDDAKAWDQYIGDAIIKSITDTQLNPDGYIQPYKPTSVAAGYNFVVNRDYLSPLPITERALNPNLTQNPGWDR